MDTLLHHIQPLMQRSITEFEESLERKMMQFTKWKIDEVNKRLDAFELRVLARPAPPVDMSTLQAAVDSLRADIDRILEARVPESEAFLSSLLRAPCWRPFLLLLKFHHLLLERVPRGVGVK